jgi:hypothetical protein
MIPYEDLVVALQAWRVKQGLPVGMMSDMITPPPVRAAAPAPAPVRTAPPAPPPARPGPPGPPPKSPTPPPLAPPDSIDEAVDDAALLEETHYENEGADFALSFGQHADGEHEGTTVDDPNGPPLRPKQRRDDW